MNMPKTVEKLIENIEKNQEITPEIAQQLLKNSNITSEDLIPWEQFNHSNDDSYGRKLIHDGKFYELMVMSWRDGDMAAIHDHGFTQWGAVTLFGCAEHAVFKLENQTLTTCARCNFPAGTTVPVNHDMIHQMGNIGQPNYLSLHLYGCYGREGGITDKSRLWNLEKESIDFTTGGAFFDLPEKAILERKEGIKFDFPTWLRHQVELVKRLLLKHQSCKNGQINCPREMKLVNQLFDRDIWVRLQKEINNMCTNDKSKCKHYCQILTQELTAMVNLQILLAEKNLIQCNSKSYISDLKNLISEQNVAQFSIKFLNLIDKTYDVNYHYKSLQAG